MWKKAFKSLKMSGGGEKDEQTDKPPDKDKEKKFTRLSSRRSLLRRKDSKDSNDAGEQQADDNEEIDPVYSLLKCAADLPKQSSRHPCTYLNRQSPQGSDSLTIRSSRSSSPSSDQKRALKHKRLQRLQCMRSQSLEEPKTSLDNVKRRHNWITGRQKSYSMDDKQEYSRQHFPDEQSPTYAKPMDRRLQHARSVAQDRLDPHPSSLHLSSSSLSRSRTIVNKQQVDDARSVRSEVASTTSPKSPHSPHRRRKKLNMRMKSFSLDTPDPPKPPAAIDAYTKKKSTSTSFTQACFRAPPQSPPSAHQRRRSFWNKSNSLEMEDSLDITCLDSASPKQGSSPKEKRRSLPANLYVVLYHYKAREKGDLDLRAGWRVNAVDTSDPDWWKGKCNGRVGYFPARYVEHVNYDDHVYQMTHSVQVSDGENEVKLLKDQIVIQSGEVDAQGLMPLRSGDKRIRCPVKYLSEI